MAIQSTFYNIDGATRSYGSTKHIATKQHMAVWLQLISDDSWTQLASTEFELINNYAVVDTVIDATTYKQLELRVADTEDELTQSQTDIGIVAGIATEINVVSTIASEIVSTSENVGSINTVGDNISSVNTVATNITSVNEVAPSVANIDTIAPSIDNVDALVPHVTSIDLVANNVDDVNNYSDTYFASHQNKAALDTWLAANSIVVNAGDMYFNLDENSMKVYNGTGWQDASATVNGTARRESFTATEGQTTFAITGNYDGGYADVYLDGAKLQNGVDVDVSSGTDVVLSTGAIAGQIVDVVAYGSFAIVDHYVKAETTYKTAATGSSELPVGTSAQRDASPLTGYLRYNTDINSFEGYNGTSWGSVGGGATGGSSDNVFFENDQVITTSYELTANKNAMTAGDITINDGVTVTIPTGASWTIV